MARRLYIEHAKNLSLADHSIVIEKEGLDKPLSFPLEDLDLVFLEDQHTLVSSSLLAEMGTVGVSIVFCGFDYLPKSILAPYNGHYLQSELLQLQLGLLPYKKKKMWEAIIRRKITNQMNVLAVCSGTSPSVNRLKSYLETLTPGDETNMEGAAAREYFATLFGPDFIRFSHSPISVALNYGYAIVASSVIRNVAYFGLCDNLGVWHQSKENANNLSYDLIEPFRQVVDYYVKCHEKDFTIPLAHEMKVGLISLLGEEVKIGGMSYKLSNAIEIEIESYIRYLRDGDISHISLPVYEPSAWDSRSGDEP